MRSPSVALFMTFAGVAAGSTFAGPASFTPLGDLAGGAFQSQARGLSADGSVVTGQSESASGTEAFVWRSGGGLIGLGDLAAGSFGSVAYGCDAAGDIVFGSGTTGASGFREATRWMGPSLVPASLGFAATGGYISVAYACSADGQSACGENLFAPTGGGGPPPLPITQAMRWTSAGGMLDLGTLPGVTPGPAHVTSARGMSADRSVIIGYAHDATSTFRPWRWTESGGLVELSGGVWAGRAFGVSPDGAVVVGARSNGGVNEPFVWTQAAGRYDPGLLAGYTSGVATDASTAGRRVCGTMLVSGVSGSNIAAVWDRGLGWRSLESALAQAGVSTAGWTLQFATAMSDDGTVIVGYGVNPSGQTEAYRIVLPPPCRADFNGAGGVSVQDIFDFLVAYFADLPSADINGVGGVTVQDIFDFLADFFSGCA